MTIKTGDLVMVVRPAPCCGASSGLGDIFIAQGAEVRERGRCVYCGAANTNYFGVYKGGRLWLLLSRLKKIDPPADGDSLPTRADIEVPA